MDIDATSQMGKLLGQFVDFLHEAAAQITELKANYEDLYEYVESIDEDLEGLEQEIRPQDADALDDASADEDDYSVIWEDEDEDEETLSFVCCSCEACKGLFYIESLGEEPSAKKFTCPNCGKTTVAMPVEFDRLTVALPVDE